MATPKTLTELASLVEKHTSTLSTGLKAAGVPEPSFAAGAPPALKVPQDLEKTYDELLETVDELRARLLGPLSYLFRLIIPLGPMTAILHSLYAFSIPSQVPLNGSISYSDLATRLNLPLDDVRHIMQTAIAFRIFEEDPSSPGSLIRHNAASAMLATVPGASDYLEIVAQEQVPGAGHFVDALKRFPGTGEPGDTGMMMACRAAAAQEEILDRDFDHSKSFFEFIADDKDRVARFAKAMGLSNNAPQLSSHYFVNALPWGEGDRDKCPETIVDIAGSYGDLCQGILRKWPGVKKATVLDLPEVVAGAKVPDDLAGRLEFAPYNFLKEKVPLEADAFVFRHIFHDWSDKYGAKILKNLVPALRNGTKIWICECVLSELRSENRWSNQLERCADMLMKVGLNGKERTREEWEAMFAMADERFHLESVTKPDGAGDSVIEVVFRW